MRRIYYLAGCLIVVVTVWGPPAFAGGWAVVTLDPLPADFVAGEPITVGFTILQHGVTPYSTGNAAIIATGPDGRTLRFSAKPEGSTGHHVAEVSFPLSGLWRWEVQPDWFPRQPLGEVVIGGSKVAPPVPTSSKATAAAEATPTWSSEVRGVGTGADASALARDARPGARPWPAAARVVMLVAFGACALVTAAQLVAYRRHAPA